MAREDEIRSVASDHRDWVCCGFIDPVADEREKSFAEGAEWADKTMIDKACEWMKKVLYIHTEVNEDKDWCTYNPIDYVTSDFESVEEFIKEFRKAMEE